MRDITNLLHVVPAFAPVAATTDDTARVSAILDLLGYDGVMLSILTGTLTDADAMFALTLTAGDAANLSDGVAVTAAELVGTLAGGGFTFADDIESRKIGYIGPRRYIRATLTPTGNTGNFFVAGNWILSKARYGPPAFPA